MTDVELIKSKIDIVDFISAYLTLKKAGRSFKALCPFHPEKTPSFIVSPERESWHCFGACATGGDVITFYQKWEGIDFLEALKSLAERAHVTLQKYTPAKDQLIKEKIYAINNLATDFFHYLLTGHTIGQRALDYLKSRNIKKEIIENFQLGYAPESWDSLHKYIAKKGYSPPDLEEAGLLIKSDQGKYYDRFRGRLIFTLKDHRGKIIGFSGRKLPSLSSTDTDTDAKYINTPETAIYIKGNVLYGLDSTREFIKKANNAIVVEGEFDFLASYQNGITNVVAIKGSALTENQVLLLKRYAETVSLALDSDIAGNVAAIRGIEIAENAGLVVNVVKLVSGKDPAECIEHGAHLWKKSVSDSVPIYDFIIDSALKKYAPDDVFGKKKIGEETIPFLTKIQNPIIASHYYKKLAKILDVSIESIETAVMQFLKNKKVNKEVLIENTLKKDRGELLEEYFLSLILQSSHIKDHLDKSMKIVTPDDFMVLPVKTILQLLKNFMKDRDKFDLKLFSPSLTPEIAPFFDRAYLIELPQFLNDEKLFLRELDKTVKEIKKISLRRTVGEISTKLNRLEDEQKSSEADQLNKEIKKLFIKLKELEK
ncbi:DNA primase [Candidatus Gottesmanbacteria bacterium RIFCSPHIGHO2_02_FULL_39_14]|uniref:DNA primase n=3 Tax=Candidatus Gottesmaniibacteriota TaxID=1752720 RepID=A0A1F5ZYC5_9BACT|nr:MAG: DNA primase [Candidatus Gottesmanbacteria bacterium RBG_16_38_7b]OGG17047.1 MAG: DNA primase [Candidatus Gottesmanbacteria bacterium RIFCSPHIGHO2_02_FULL_39_14]OGG31833.1 MAG: DNA primase [Candidatus Gottesmanbacteria bacterium RIFCSPLOWO2_02_FULL_38_8]